MLIGGEEEPVNGHLAVLLVSKIKYLVPPKKEKFGGTKIKYRQKSEKFPPLPEEPNPTERENLSQRTLSRFMGEIKLSKIIVC